MANEVKVKSTQIAFLCLRQVKFIQYKHKIV